MLAVKGESATNQFIREQVLSGKLPYEETVLKDLKSQWENDPALLNLGKYIACPQGAVR